MPRTPHPTLHQTSLPTLPTCVIVNKNSIMPKEDLRCYQAASTATVTLFKSFHLCHTFYRNKIFSNLCHTHNTQIQICMFPNMNFNIFTNNFIAPVSHTHFLDICWQNEYIYSSWRKECNYCPNYLSSGSPDL